jgi:hypothetical protein
MFLSEYFPFLNASISLFEDEASGIVEVEESPH